MPSNALSTNVERSFKFGLQVQAGLLLSVSQSGGFQQLPGELSTGEFQSTIDIQPSDAVRRRTARWRGMAVEIVQTTGCERIDSRFRGNAHLLVVHERGARRDGDTFVEGLTRSTLRDCGRKLTFVPAGHRYQDWQMPRQPGRAIYFYFDPALFPVPAEGLQDEVFAPKLFFENAALWDTAMKLAAVIESGDDTGNQPYVEALGVVLAHELVRLNGHPARTEPVARGGLSPWQQRVVTAYIEEHLAEPISLAVLAGLARLSTFYFCRAFKQSFGVPPHRYHTNRRIERAKALLANAEPSVTDIGLTLGFSETSSFSAAFRKATGLTPTAYHRSLG
ncbi:MAG: helix-turn-helix transcriptional regulator [Xanthobacteraceae bacterium]